MGREGRAKGAWRVLVLAMAAGSCGGTTSDENTVSRWRLEPTVTIGATDADTSRQFTDIAEIEERNRLVYVRQRHEQVLRVFDSTGRHLRTIGRTGSGPGEFRELFTFGFTADTLWTIDWGLRRISWFALDGTLLATSGIGTISRPLGTAAQTFAPYPQALTIGDTALGFGGTSGQAIAEGRVVATPILQMSREGLVRDTVAWMPRRHEDIILRSDRGTLYHDQPFGDGPFSIMMPASRRIAIVDAPAPVDATTAAYRITVIDARGDTIWTRMQPVAPTSLPAQRRDSVRSAFVRAYGSKFGVEQIDRGLFLPAFVPPVRSGLEGADGSLWIREVAPRGARYAVFSSSGDPIGHVDIEDRTTLHWVGADAAWAATKDADDVPQLTRYRIRRPD